MQTASLPPAISSRYRAVVLTAAADFPWLVPAHVTPASLDVVGGGMLADGDCGGFVALFGREFARKVLVGLEPLEEFECCAALRDAIEGGVSLADEQGEAGRNFYTAALAGGMVAGAAAAVPPVDAGATADSPPVVLCPLGQELREVLALACLLYADTLPEVITGPDCPAFGFDMQTSPVNFDGYANSLALGLAGLVLRELGREFCAHLLPGMRERGLGALCEVMEVAIEAGVCYWDEVGYLPAESAQTNLPDALGCYPSLPPDC